MPRGNGGRNNPKSKSVPSRPPQPSTPAGCTCPPWKWDGAAWTQIQHPHCPAKH